MFRSYFGKSHYVVTSVCLRTSQSLDVFYTLAQIDFVDYYPALEELIQSYIFEKQPLDKAGAYGIQELDPRFVAVFTETFIPLSVFQQRKYLAGYLTTAILKNSRAGSLVCGIMEDEKESL